MSALPVSTHMSALRQRSALPVSTHKSALRQRSALPVSTDMSALPGHGVTRMRFFAQQHVCGAMSFSALCSPRELNVRTREARMYCRCGTEKLRVEPDRATQGPACMAIQRLVYGHQSRWMAIQQIEWPASGLLTAIRVVGWPSSRLDGHPAAC